jgi:1,4-alpha-glucan branching enzyme
LEQERRFDAATSPKFLKGDSSSSYLQNGAGVGYQIMVASYADSDGDGFGDIYGIDQKLDYLKNLGVNVLWLTPIQVSDSYHGYDIADYTMVDPKFGSSKSPAAVASGGVVTQSHGSPRL